MKGTKRNKLTLGVMTKYSTEINCKPLILKDGIMNKYNDLFKKIGDETYYYILCIINGNKEISDISAPYPKIYAFSRDNFILKSKILLMAEKAKLKILPVTEQLNLIFAPDTSLDGVLLLAYIEKLMSQNNFDEIYQSYISGKLYGYSEEDIRGYYLLSYIGQQIPVSIKSKMKSSIGYDKKTYLEQFKEKLSEVNRIDNLTDFNNKFKQIKIDGNKWITKTLKSHEFSKYKSNMKNKIKSFKVDMKYLKEDPYYNIEIIKEIKKSI